MTACELLETFMKENMVNDQPTNDKDYLKGVENADFRLRMIERRLRAMEQTGTWIFVLEIGNYSKTIRLFSVDRFEADGPLEEVQVRLLQVRKGKFENQLLERRHVHFAAGTNRPI